MCTRCGAARGRHHTQYVVVADDQTYLAELIAKRRAMIGVRRTSIADQSTEFDIEQLNSEIGRVERALAEGSRTRYAVVNKGFGV